MLLRLVSLSVLNLALLDNRLYSLADQRTIDDASDSLARSEMILLASVLVVKSSDWAVIDALSSLCAFHKLLEHSLFANLL